VRKGAQPSNHDHTLSIPLSTMVGMFTSSEPRYKPGCEGSRFRTVPRCRAGNPADQSAAGDAIGDRSPHRPTPVPRQHIRIVAMTEPAGRGAHPTVRTHPGRQFAFGSAEKREPNSLTADRRPSVRAKRRPDDRRIAPEQGEHTPF
jgi:hypothetical protein